MNESFDIAVIGSGFAGSLMAMVARRLGYSVVLIEKGRHPRVVIGESSTPLSNLLLEQLADTYHLPMLKALTKWGSWQKGHPELGCGLKRGFSFFHHDLNNPGGEDFGFERQLIVAASPHDQIADTHWFRADTDQFLVQQAQSVGVAYLDEFVVHKCVRTNGSWNINGLRSSTPLSINAGFLIDATGPRGFLHRMLRLGEAILPDYPATSSLYCHFTGVEKYADVCGHDNSAVPFPIDDAAVHHIFEGGWMWVLRFNNGWTSAGIAATRAASDRLHLYHGEPAWHRLLDQLPLVKKQFAKAKPATPFKYLPTLPFCSDSITGDGWALLPATAGFVDPLLSTGFPLTLLGIQRLAVVLDKQASPSHLSDRLSTYAYQTSRELLATASLIGGLYNSMGNFSKFRSLSLLYFAAASYSETARRLGKPELADSFLLSNDPIFARAFDRLLMLAREDSSGSQQDALERAIHKLVDQYDVAGLCKRPQNNYYPVSADDLYQAALKLGATASDIDQLLDRSGFIAH